MAYRDTLDEDGQRRYEAYWRWYTERQRRREIVAGAACFAAGAEHEARVLAEQDNERIRELERQNVEMLTLATKCAGALQRDLGPIKHDVLETLLIKINEWIVRNRG
jgi:hypothetical protein